jgi:tRNA threonylcarbamoyladenosine biosynthesis protein TsaB
MAIILNLETSSKICSVAIADNGQTTFEQTGGEDFSHSAVIGSFVQNALNFLSEREQKLDAVAVSEGPGSYTGLRIGISFAKGLCYGLNIPLIAVPTLKLLAKTAADNLKKSDPGVSFADYLVAMLDARRMEVYAAVYAADLSEIAPAKALIIDENSFSEYLLNHKIIFFGDGSDKCKNVITSPNALFIDKIIPSAESMSVLAENLFSERQFVDTAYFEPFYLKEFQATTPKNKVFL